MSPPNVNPPGLKVLSWNIGKRIPKRLKQISAAIDSVQPDVLTLQEVPSGQATTLNRALASLGLHHIRHSHSPMPEGIQAEFRHHCVIASRWPLRRENPDADAWRAEAPFPESLCRAVVEAPFGPVDVLTTHIPNGTTYGWGKIDTFDVLAESLRKAPDAPRVLTGDFNEPEHFRSSGQIEPWGGDDWREGVLSVLAGQSQHGLRDAYRDRHGVEVPTPITPIGSSASPARPAASITPSSPGTSRLSTAGTATIGTARR